MGERIVPTDPQEIDADLLARLLLGAQSEHEQRLVATRLLRRDSVCRATVAAIVEPFEMFDLSFVAEYAKVLEEGRHDVESRRREILGRASARADLEKMLYHFTYSDVLELGEATRKLFTWTMAETLLDRTRRVRIADHEVATSLYLALMVIDVVEMLGVVGHSPQFPEVVRDVRQRISNASRSLRGSRSPGGRTL